MRAKDFINESYKAKPITKRQGNGAVGIGKFRDPSGFDRTYELNRIMMALACSDGVNPIVNGPSQESWSGRFNTAHAFTEKEEAMIRQAMEYTGTEYHDLAKGDLKSQELDDTNKASVVISFKGFNKKK